MTYAGELCELTTVAAPAAEGAGATVGWRERGPAVRGRREGICLPKKTCLLSVGVFTSERRVCDKPYACMMHA
jgi:hypothetical protein